MPNHYITGRRIYLREVCEVDVSEAYRSWINDPEVNRFLETRFLPRSIKNIKEYVNQKGGNENEPFFAICLLESDQHIGNIKLGPINWVHRKADISLVIGAKEFWGKGYAVEAISLVTDYAFNVIGLNKVKAGVYAANLASISAFEKCGFLKEALLRNEVFCEGHFMNVVLMGLTAKDYITRGEKK